MHQGERQHFGTRERIEMDETKILWPRAEVATNPPCLMLLIVTSWEITPLIVGSYPATISRVLLHHLTSTNTCGIKCLDSPAYIAFYRPYLLGPHNADENTLTGVKPWNVCPLIIYS